MAELLPRQRERAITALDRRAPRHRRDEATGYKLRRHARHRERGRCLLMLLMSVAHAASCNAAPAGRQGTQCA